MSEGAAGVQGGGSGRVRGQRTRRQWEEPAGGRSPPRGIIERPGAVPPRAAPEGAGPEAGASGRRRALPVGAAGLGCRRALSLSGRSAPGSARVASFPAPPSARGSRGPSGGVGPGHGPPRLGSRSRWLRGARYQKQHSDPEAARLWGRACVPLCRPLPAGLASAFSTASIRCTARRGSRGNPASAGGAGQPGPGRRA